MFSPFKRQHKKYEQSVGWMRGIVPGQLPTRSAFVVPKYRLAAVACGIMLLLLVLCARLLQLQFFQGDYYYVLSETNRIIERYISYERGIVYDKTGKKLAENTPAYQATLVYGHVPTDIDEYSIWSREVMEAFNMKQEEFNSFIEQAQKQPFTETVIRSSLEQEQVIQLQTRTEPLAGITLRPTLERQYPEPEAFAHILGYTAEITADELSKTEFTGYSLGEKIGRGGVEASFQHLLKGTYGKELMEVDSEGKGYRSIARVDPLPGASIYLSIEADLQLQAAERLRHAMDERDASAGVVIMQDVRTGKVLSLVSFPSYDNNLFRHGLSVDEFEFLFNNQQRPLFNRALSGVFPPGSTVKPFIGLAALEESLISEHTRISDIPQIIEVGGGRFPDWRVSWGRGPLGLISIQDAIAESSNIFFYKISGGYEDLEGLGVEKIKHYLQQFLIGELTGIDIPGEVKGVIPDPAWKLAHKNEQWYLGDNYLLGIGQGNALVTPLQLVNATTALANGGKLFQPQIIERVVDRDGNVIDQIPPKVIRELPYSDRNLAIIREGMRQAVTDGVVFPLRYATVSVAAKTGTAEFGIADEEGVHETHAWVEGFFPYEDPEVSFVVLLEKGGSSEYAAEVARDIINWYVDKDGKEAH